MYEKKCIFAVAFGNKVAKELSVSTGDDSTTQALAILTGCIALHLLIWMLAAIIDFAININNRVPAVPT